MSPKRRPARTQADLEGTMSRPILIIEDDQEIAEVLRHSLEARSFETRVAFTGSEGLSASLDKERPPLLILLDLLLPEMNGLEICRRLRKEPATERTPIIMLTAKSAESDFLNARHAGVDDYITKPFSVQDVLERINMQLDLRHAGRTLKIL